MLFCAAVLQPIIANDCLDNCQAPICSIIDHDSCLGRIKLKQQRSSARSFLKINQMKEKKMCKNVFNLVQSLLCVVSPKVLFGFHDLPTI